MRPLILAVLAVAFAVPTSQACTRINFNTTSSLFEARANTRVLSDVLTGIRHPFLSFNGYACATGSTCHKGRGLRELLYDQPDDAVLRTYFSGFGRKVQSYTQNPNNPNTTDVRYNIQNGQYLALAAILTFMVENSTGNASATYSVNDLNCYVNADGLNSNAFGSHESIRAEFMELLRTPSHWKIDGNQFNVEPLQWSGEAAGMARMIDLYLTLENFYQRKYGYDEALMYGKVLADRETERDGRLRGEPVLD